MSALSKVIFTKIKYGLISNDFVTIHLLTPKTFCMCKGAKPEYDSTKLELEVADKKESLVRKNKRKEV